MPSKMIGTQAFALFQGSFAGYGIELNEIVRDGLDGQVFQDIGVRGKPSSIRTLTGAGSTAAVAAAKNTYLGMQGNTYTAYDSLGNSATVVVLGVSPGREQRIGIAVGGLSTYSDDYMFYTFWDLMVI